VKDRRTDNSCLDPRPEIRNPKPETRNPRFTWHDA
jgi:hypothetical protein